MEQDRVNMFVMQHSKHFSAQDMMIVRQRLEDITEDRFMYILSLDFKSPTVAIVLSWFLSGFGVGAFYIKKIGFGIAQIIVYIMYIIFYIMFLFSANSSSEDIWGVLMGISGLVMVILFLVGVINARKWTQQYNFKKFIDAAQLF